MFSLVTGRSLEIAVCDAVGVTVVLLICGYKGQKFVRGGYCVNNSYTDPELQENPPSLIK